MDQLSVVNRMLGKMGEVPVESLTEDHDFIPACLRALNDMNRIVQTRGYWFNTEVLTVTPDANGFINLPGDVLSVITKSRSHIKRGAKLYDTENGTDVFADEVCMSIVRLLAFDDLVPEAQTYIAHRAVAEFQSDYDGDTTKTRQLLIDMAEAKVVLNAAHIRNIRLNAIDNHPRLRRLHFQTRGIRYST
jgi:hypothetical protein